MQQSGLAGVGGDTCNAIEYRYRASDRNVRFGWEQAGGACKSRARGAAGSAGTQHKPQWSIIREHDKRHIVMTRGSIERGVRPYTRRLHFAEHDA